MRHREHGDRAQELDKLYTLAELPQHTCTYCGGPTKGGLDHLPALSTTEKLPIEKLTDGTTQLWLVPACLSCNRRAGTTGSTVAERRARVGQQLASELKIKKSIWKNRFNSDELERAIAWNRNHQADPEPTARHNQSLFEEKP